MGYLPTFIEFTGEETEFRAEIAERITAELLDPAADGEPYRARFVAEIAGPVEGEWSASGTYFFDRERVQAIPVRVGEDGAAEIILPLNAWPNLPIKGRRADISLYLPGRMLGGTLEIDTTGG